MPKEGKIARNGTGMSYYSMFEDKSLQTPKNPSPKLQKINPVMFNTLNLENINQLTTIQEKRKDFSTAEERHINRIRSKLSKSPAAGDFVSKKRSVDGTRNISPKPNNFASTLRSGGERN